MKLILAVFLAWFLFSCNSSKQIAKKDQKYVGYILSKPALTDQIYKVGLALHPVMPSESVLVPGKTITVIDSSFAQKDIESLNSVIDSLLSKNCPIENIDSLRKAIKKEVEKNCKPRIIDHRTTDTLKIPDPKLLDAISRELSYEKGVSSEKDKKVTQLESANNKKMWWLIAAAVVILFLAYLLVKPKIR